MKKSAQRIIPVWAWALVLLTPVLLIGSFFWFLVNHTLQSSALVQLIAKTSEAGLLEQPEINELALTALGGPTPVGILFACLALVVMFNFAIMFSARRQSIHSQIGTGQGS